MLRLVAVVLVACALSGCFGDASAPVDTSDRSAASSGRAEEQAPSPPFWTNYTLSIAASSNPGVYTVNEEQVPDISIPNGSRVTVVMTWEPTPTSETLTVVARRADEVVEAVDGPSPLTWSRDQAEEGLWTFRYGLPWQRTLAYAEIQFAVYVEPPQG